MRSAIYSGFVQHRRFSPKSHSFTYKVFMPFIDLDELDSVFNQSWLWSAYGKNMAYLNRNDFYGEKNLSIKNAIIERVHQQLGNLPIVRVCLLANLRYFGHSFNPITSYYCYDKDDQLLCTVAEVTNTPWKEKHCYLIQNISPSEKLVRSEFDKTFHVSPFLPMEMRYRWQNNSPSDSLYIHMENIDNQNNKIFDASLVLKREEISAHSLDLKILAYPFMTLNVVVGIYWQAFKLFLKGMHFYSHPKSNTRPT